MPGTTNFTKALSVRILLTLTILQCGSTFSQVLTTVPQKTFSSPTETLSTKPFKQPISTKIKLSARPTTPTILTISMLNPTETSFWQEIQLTTLWIQTIKATSLRTPLHQAKSKTWPKQLQSTVRNISSQRPIKPAWSTRTLPQTKEIFIQPTKLPHKIAWFSTTPSRATSETLITFWINPWWQGTCIRTAKISTTIRPWITLAIRPLIEISTPLKILLFEIC